MAQFDIDRLKQCLSDDKARWRCLYNGDGLSDDGRTAYIQIEHRYGGGPAYRVNVNLGYRDYIVLISPSLQCVTTTANNLIKQRLSKEQLLDMHDEATKREFARLRKANQ